MAVPEDPFGRPWLRTLAFDRRGHGRSDDPGRGYDYDTLAGDLSAVIEQLDLDDVTLVGHSMAGGEIVRYLTRFGSQHVARVVLLAATLPFPLKTGDNPDGVDGALVEAVRATWRHDYPRWLADNAGPYIGEGLAGCSVGPGLRDWTVRDMLRASLKAVFDCNRALVETDFRAELPRITTPTLIIQGDHDMTIPVELSGRKQLELIPGSHIKVYENGPMGCI